ncbi:DUF6480 family protein [Qaidamihabitans albus]|uniref:DUF6480 family protein n=1 Tax=Qaidamihabitans albus TaxID=2795733 RepID=UPI0018F2101E|nr:DUF6480 family protein [Qaidamihabitans albus]
MTARPPDPDPRETPGLERGGGVAPGDTPPESGQVSGLSHQEPRQSRKMSLGWVLAIAVVVVLVAGFFVAYAVALLGE